MTIRGTSRAALCLALTAALPAAGQARRPKTEPATAPAASSRAEVDQAESLIQKRDYPGAIALLDQYNKNHPDDAIAWYDLGFAQEASGDKQKAAAAYQRSVGLNNKIFESTFALAELRYALGDRDQALKLFADATHLTPASDPSRKKAAAYRYVGELSEASDAKAAGLAYESGLQLAPDDAEIHFGYGLLLEKTGDLARASQQLLASAKQATGDLRRQAVAAAVDVAIHSKSFELTEGLLSQLVAADPGDAILHVQLARLLQAKGDQAGSLAQLESAQKLGPELPQVLRARADMLAAGKRFSEAADAYKQLLARQDQSGDARLHQQYAVVLMQLHQFVEAQHELIRALQLDAKLADAYGDLAVCASENKQYGLALQVLDARAKMLPETPGTYYLRATAFDNLRQFPQAAQNYKQFLSASNGKFPDEEWKARHRLAAIDKR